MDFIVSMGKHYDSTDEYINRLGVFNENRSRVEALNRDNVGVSFEMNFSGDMTDAEWESRQGLDASLAVAPASCDDD